MKCPICNIDIPDTIYKRIPCEKCGCMDLMDKDARLKWRAKSDLEAAMLVMHERRKEEEKK